MNGKPAMLMALLPVIILPISSFAFKEKIGWQAILGPTLAIAGIAVLFPARSRTRKGIRTSWM